MSRSSTARWEQCLRSGKAQQRHLPAWPQECSASRIAENTEIASISRGHVGDRRQLHVELLLHSEGTGIL